MAVPKIMLLSHIAPSQNGVGRLHLRQLCSLYPRDRICCFHTDGQAGEDNGMNWLPASRHRTFNEYGHRSSHRFLQWGYSLGDWAAEEVSVRRLIHSATNFGKRHAPDLLWTILYSPACIRMAKEVAGALKVPLLATVWDPPDYVMKHIYHRDNLTRRRITKEFDRTMKNVSRCSVASDELKQEYENAFSTQCVKMTYCPARLPNVENRRPATNDTFILGYAGWVYCLEEWKALLNSLASCHWTIGGRKVVLRVIGHGFCQNMFIPMNVEVLGWRDPETTQALLAECDAVYMPYWMADDYREAVRLCFPSKFASYVAARVPIFYHGPKDSTIARFLDRYGVGLGCHSFEPDDILSSLHNILTDSDKQQDFRRSCDDAYREELGPHVFRHRFSKFVDIDENSLAPLT